MCSFKLLSEGSLLLADIVRQVFFALCGSIGSLGLKYVSNLGLLRRSRGLCAVRF